MKYRQLTQVIAIIVVIVFAAGITLSGGTVQIAWLRFLSVAVLIATAVLTVYEVWAWRIAPVQRVKQIAPSTRGTWRGTLASEWTDPATGKRYPVKTVYLVVRQSASAIRVSLVTDESQSLSRVAAITKESDDTWVIDYTYFNKPELRLRARSPIHHGGGTLKVVGRPARRIEGSYWTDRDSKGQLAFDSKRSGIADDFKAAEELFTE